MKESLLHTVWQYQYFNKESWTTTDGLPIQVLHPGYLNSNAGPDFNQAKVKLGDMLWQGDVEIHIGEQSWFGHQHQHDKAYNGVILHIVYSKGNQRAIRQDGTVIPTASLIGRISENVLARYRNLETSENKIACSSQLVLVPEIVKLGQLERALVERLARKQALLLQNQKADNIDWEEISYQAVMQALGFKVNSMAMLELSQKLPYKIIRKHSNNLLQVEALLFGVANLLPQESTNEYTGLLVREWALLKHKYNLVEVSATNWKFSRMRPANFPTLRLAQAARLLSQPPSLFAFFKDSTIEELLTKLRVTPSGFWSTHYHFNKPSEGKISALGKASAILLILNAVVPLRVAYARFTGKDADMEKAYTILEQLPAENNSIIEDFKALGVIIKSAFDTQAILEQYANYCMPKKCLRCKIGLAILQPSI